jgi:MBG domain-containing protein/YDG domain-containing protein/immunoglobulin I-set domain protein
MKKSWILFLFGTLLTIGDLAISARAQSYLVYAAEYGQANNLFGTIDLLNGNFTKISSIGKTKINDIAYCPANGIMYGISNTTALVTFNTTNGTITEVASLSVNGIESLAFRPSDGVLFGATQTNLYTINPANGSATLVGSYGNPHNLDGTGQNIRFAQDGNLYLSNTSTNTDIYQINTTNGAATWMGEATGFSYLVLENASQNMYGVFVKLGSSGNTTPELANFNLGSFVNGGTNANGSTHQIAVTLVGAGTNFPANFNFSGDVPQAVTNLTVPVSATGPVSQTVCPGDSAVFSTVASGTPPYGYVWLENGTTISGQTNSTLTLANVSASDAATYSVIVSGPMGTVTNSATLTVNVPVAVTAAPANQTSMAGGNATFNVTATGTGLSYQWLFNGSVIGTGSSLALNNLTTSQAGVYSVIVNGTCDSVTNSATLTVNVPVAAMLIVTQQPSSMATAGSAFSAQPVVTVEDINGNTATSYSTPITVTETSGGSLNGTSTLLTVTPVNGVATFNGLFVTNAANGVTLSFTSGSLTPATSGTINVSPASAYRLVFVTQPAGATYKTALATPPVVMTQDQFGNNSTTGLGTGVNVTLTLTTGTGPLVGTTTANIGTGGGDGTASFAGVQVNRAENGDVLTASATGLASAMSTAFNVAPQAITVTAATNTKNYDGTVSAAATPAITAGTLAAGDTANFSETYADRNVGTGLTLTPSGTVADGNSGSNYTYTFIPVTSGVINAATLTVTPKAVVTTYNGIALNNAAYSDNVGNYSITGFQNGETAGSVGVTLGGLLAFNGSTGTSVNNVGTYTQTVGTLVLSSTNNNYVMNFGNPTPNNYVINPAALTITAVANTKTYDGTISAAATPTISGLQGVDTVTSLAETYDTQNAGTGKTLSVSAYTVNDNNAGSNYVVSTVANTSGVINAATLTVTANDQSKMCGMPNPLLTASYAGFVGGENIGVLTSPVTLSTTATTGSGVGIYPITVSGVAAANYVINYVNGTLTVFPMLQLSSATANVNGTRQFIVSWPTILGQSYQLEYTASLPAASWTPLNSPVIGTGLLMAVTNSVDTAPQCFFRVMMIMQ